MARPSSWGEKAVHEDDEFSEKACAWLKGYKLCANKVFLSCDAGLFDGKVTEGSQRFPNPGRTSTC